MNLPHIKVCKDCGRPYDYEVCPFCLAKKKREEEKEIKKWMK